jgi:O-antigen chain-terminating methyltransferase
VEQNFQWKGDLLVDLQALKEQLARASPFEMRRGGSGAIDALLKGRARGPEPAPVKRLIWRRVFTYLKSLLLLSGTRHRTALLEQDLEKLPALLGRALRSELDAVNANVAALNESLNAAVIEVGTQHQALRAATQHVEARHEARLQRLEALGGTLQLGLQGERAARQRWLLEMERGGASSPSVASPGLRWQGREAQHPGSQGLEAQGLEALGLDMPPSARLLAAEFYAALEDRYRGSHEGVRQRLVTAYRDDLAEAARRTENRGLFIDIGCGRGEFLEVMAEDGLAAIGVEISDTQARQARDKGNMVVVADARSFLSRLESRSITAVTGVHIVEHLPFEELVALVQEVVRVLRPGGLALFETPNPRNLIVGATTFHLDPTHIKPLPPEVLGLLLETAGFAKVEIRPLHPSDTLDYMVEHAGLDPHLASLLFGPQDYAALGILE